MYDHTHHGGDHNHDDGDDDEDDHGHGDTDELMIMVTSILVITRRKIHPNCSYHCSGEDGQQ